MTMQTKGMQRDLGMIWVTGQLLGDLNVGNRRPGPCGAGRSSLEILLIFAFTGSKSGVAGGGKVIEGECGRYSDHRGRGLDHRGHLRVRGRVWRVIGGPPPRASLRWLGGVDHEKGGGVKARSQRDCEV